MIRVTAPNSKRSFTSGQSFDSEFRMTIKGEEISEYEKLRIEGEVKSYDGEEMEDGLHGIITVEYVSRAEELPCTVYLPDTSSRVQPSFDVYRGPLHPRDDLYTFEVELTVYGGDGDEENWERIGSDTVTLFG